MTPEFPPVVIYPMESGLRLVELAPGVDASVEPLLSHAGLLCEFGNPMEVAMHGITGTSDRLRQFLTTATNVFDHEQLVLLAAEFNAPSERARRKENMRARLRLVHPQPAQTPEPDADAPDTPEP
jgi:hypothetical protein